uniref:Uncharacterized protein n=1 Tax=Kalanchoe fedtschenkoi TaxID=63787 RepID=A0A7N0T161_KALFE
MAAHDPSAVPTHSAQVVGNAFVEQYYQVLHQSPAHVYKFYQDLSFLSRPDSKGNMTTVTTTQAINDKILSLNYEECTVEIETADAQDSYNGGVIVLVTGCLTEKGCLRRKFTQTFFLAPQEPGYFVLNDVFRYLEEKKPQEPHSLSENSIKERVLPATVEPPTEPTHVPQHHTLEPTSFEENVAEVHETSDNEDAPPVEKDIVDPPIEANPTEAHVVVDSGPALQGDAPKISYASIVKVMKAPMKSTPVYVPTNIAKVPASVAERQPPGAKPVPPQEASVPGNESALENNNIPEEAEGHSIYVRNLPLSATVEQLQDEFKRFGPIKRDGIQVRSNKGFCFGFVEFELQSSMQSALEASPVTIGDRKAVVEEKRTTTRVGSNGRGGRPNSSGRGGYRGESFRGRGNYGGGRGYGRSDFRNPGEFSGRSRGPGGRSGGRDGYQWVNQSEAAGRGGRGGGTPA